jgi:RNAse (barnase) inhibitor barstar
MATFKQDPSEWERLDWQLLQISPVTLYFQQQVLESDVFWFATEGYRVRSLKAGAYSSPEALLVALADLLSFPDYFGRNLDAFNDCLRDVEVPELGGLLLVLEGFGMFANFFRYESQAILDICASQSRCFLLTGRRFLVLVQADDPDISFEPVGATPVTWNPREWLNAKRGI